MSHSGSSVTWDTGGEIHLTFACKTDAFCPSLLVASFLNNKTQSCSISLSSGRQLYSVLCGGGEGILTPTIQCTAGGYSHPLYSALRRGCTHIHCTVHCRGVLTPIAQYTAGEYSHPLYSALWGGTHAHCTVHCGGYSHPLYSALLLAYSPSSTLGGTQHFIAAMTAQRSEAPCLRRKARSNLIYLPLLPFTTEHPGTGKKGLLCQPALSHVGSYQGWPLGGVWSPRFPCSLLSRAL